MAIMTVSKTVVLCSSQSMRANGSLVKRISHNATDVRLKVRVLQELHKVKCPSGLGSGLQNLIHQFDSDFDLLNIE